MMLNKNITRPVFSLIMICNKFLFLLSISIFMLFSGCDKKDRLESINFGETVELKEARSFYEFEINISVGSMITPEEGYVYYKKLLDYIGKKSKISVNFIEKKSYAEINALLKNSDIDVAFVCGGPYVKGRDDFGLELLAAPLVDGKAIYYSYIIVARDSAIGRFEDLKGKKFAFTDPMSNTGKLVPTAMLHKLGTTPQTFFKEYSFTYGHDNSIMAVAKRIVDGAAVDSLVWEYMNKTNDRYTSKTKIIKISEPYGIPPIVARHGLNEELKKRIKRVLLNMHKDQEGKQILDGMFVDKFVEIDDSNYDTIRKVAARIGE